MGFIAELAVQSWGASAVELILEEPTPAGAGSFFDWLPDSIINQCLLPNLPHGSDTQALRATCRRARLAVNQRVRRLRLSASSLHGARLGNRFPCANSVTVFDDAAAPVTDASLAACLSTSPQLLAQLEEVNVKQCHYLGRRALLFLAQHCPRLRCLWPSRWIDNGVLREVTHFTGLQELHLGDEDVDILTLDDMGLSMLCSMRSLQMLSLQRCRWVGDPACLALAGLHSLRRLSLAHTDVGARGLAWLAALPNLHALDLSDCRNVDDDALAQLSGLTSLTSLVLRNTTATNGGLHHVTGMRLLLELDLGSRWELNDEGLQSLAACPSLCRLSAGSFNLARPAPRRGFSHLSHLGFGGSGFANRGLEQLFPLPALKSLHVHGIDAVTDTIMRTVSSQTSLEQLVLRAGYNLTDAGLDQLAGLRNLGTLSLSACPAISHACLATFVAAHQRLGQLLVGICPLLADSRDAMYAMAAV